MKRQHDWQRRAVVIFAVSIIFLSVILTIFAIREAERERLVADRDAEEELQTSAGFISDQVVAAISEIEKRVERLLLSRPSSGPEQDVRQLCNRIAESAEIISEIFILNERGEVEFPLFHPLYQLGGESEIYEGTEKLEADSLFQNAEAAEFRTRNYPLAIQHYQRLAESASDTAIRAALLNRVGRCYEKLANHPRALEVYRKVLEICPREAGTDGIPVGLLAQYQIGNIFLKIGEKKESLNAFLEMHKDLLESRWPLTRDQFHFFLDEAGKALKTSLPGKPGTGDEVEIAKRWEDVERLETQRLARMRTVDGLVQKIIPRLTNEKEALVEKARKFHRISERAEKELALVSYTSYSPGVVLGMAFDSKAISERMLSAILDKLPARGKQHFRIADEAGATVAGRDIGQMEEPRPRLALSKRFANEFPPWTIEIYQSGADTAGKEFRLKRNIYILTVAVVMMAVLFGGVLAIRSTAKELRLARMKSEFVATVSHEFRTPLTSIRYMAELLQRGRVQGEEKKEHYYETISQESDRLSRLIENILDFSKIEAGVKEYQFEETDIGELARDVASRFSGQITEKEFIVRSEISGQIPLIPADREAISRALFNVLDNAVKYSGNSREAFLRAWSDKENIYLELRDQGIGIGKDEQKRVFEKFFRSEHIHDSSIRGSGIGLTLVSHIVRAHDGEVMLESELGKGTCVTIKLPIRKMGDKNG